MATRLLLILLLSFSAFAQTSQTTSINGIANQTTSGVGIVGQQTVDGVNNTTIAAAIAAANASNPLGSVYIPATYPCTENWQATTANTNSVPVVDMRSCSQTSYSVKRFGAKGDGMAIGTCTFTAGQSTITCNGTGNPYQFVQGDVGKVLVVEGGLLPYPSNNVNNPDGYLVTTVQSVTGGVATIPTTFSQSGSVHYAWLTTDDTAAFTAWSTYLNSLPANVGGSVGIGLIPRGRYWVTQTQYFSQPLTIVGEGTAASYVVNGNFNGADLFFVWQADSYSTARTTFKDFSLNGFGNATTGNLLVQSRSMTMEDMLLQSNGGRAILQLTEQSDFTRVKIYQCRQAVVGGGVEAVNETYFTDSSFISNGETYNNLMTGTAWIWNVNAVNGVMPVTGNIVADQHAIVEMDNNVNYKFDGLSIKALYLAGMHWRSNAASHLQNVYIEQFVNGLPNPTVIEGGSHESTTLGTAMTSTTQLSFPITTGQWFLNGIGSASDISKAHNSAPAILIIPCDYNPNSSAASTCSVAASGPTILQNSAEIITTNGLINGGSTWTVSGVARNASATGGATSTGAFVWPSTAIVEQLWNSNNNSSLNITSGHFSNSAESGSPFTLTCNPNTQNVCGTFIVGAEPDAYFLWGSSNAITSAFSLNIDGNPQINTGSGMTQAEIHGGAGITSSVPVQSAQINPLTALSVTMPSIGGSANRVQYSASFTGTTASSINITGISNTATAFNGSTLVVGMPISGSGIPANTIIASIVSSSAITISNAATTSVSGDTLTVTSGPTFVYKDAALTAFVSGNSNSAVATNYVNAFAASAGVYGAIFGYDGYQCTHDDYNTVVSTSLYRTCQYGGQFGTPGQTVEAWNTTGSAYSKVFQVQVASGAVPTGILSLTTVGGTFSINNSTTQIPGVGSAVLTTGGTGNINFQGTTGIFIDSSKQMRCNSTFGCRTVGVEIKTGSASNNDIGGQLTFSSSTTASYTFNDTYTSHPLLLGATGVQYFRSAAFDHLHGNHSIYCEFCVRPNWNSGLRVHWPQLIMKPTLLYT